jgi:hypothetical protein
LSLNATQRPIDEQPSLDHGTHFDDTLPMQ